MAKSTPRKTSKPTVDLTWASALQESIQSEARLPQGEGWKTREEIIAELDLSNHRFWLLIKSLRAQGQVEEFNGCIKRENRLRRSVWYRLVAQ